MRYQHSAFRTLPSPTGAKAITDDSYAADLYECASARYSDVMDILPEYLPSETPILWASTLPADQKVAGESLISNISSISTHCRQLSAAVALFGFCVENDAKGKLFGDWMLIAARDGAMTIRNYGKALASIRSLIGLCVSWAERTDLARLKAAEKRFQLLFPFADKLRHSVAHPEFYNDASKGMGVKNPTGIPGSTFSEDSTFISSNSLFNDEFVATFEGVVVKYSVSAVTAKCIAEITLEIFASLPSEHPVNRR